MYNYEVQYLILIISSIIILIIKKVILLPNAQRVFFQALDFNTIIFSFVFHHPFFIKSTSFFFNKASNLAFYLL
jgi:hypothetical protein